MISKTTIKKLKAKMALAAFVVVFLAGVGATSFGVVNYSLRQADTILNNLPTAATTLFSATSLSAHAADRLGD